MSKSRLLAGVALAALCLPVAALNPLLPLGATAAQAQSVSVNFQLFFNELQPHGVWVRHDRYRHVFCPTGIDTEWRPYTNGRWLYLEDHGWYFASEEPHAWATYHYGRWFADQELGWCWVPGTKWAPAWVSWRSSDDIVGWAPLPPENDGYVVSLEVSRRELPAAYWVYVPTQRFVEPDLSVSIVFGNSQPEYYTQTRYLGPVVVEGDVVINNVIEVNYIEQVVGQQVVVYQTEAATAPTDQAVTADSQVITVFNQEIAEADNDAAPPEAVEQAEAVEAITAAGGTAGATADIAAEGESQVPESDAGTEAEAAPDAAAVPASEAATDTEADAAVESEAGAAVEAETDDTVEAETDAAEPAAEAETDAAAEPAAEAEVEAATDDVEAEATTDTAPTDDEAVEAAPSEGEAADEPATEDPTVTEPSAEGAVEEEITTDEAAPAEVEEVPTDAAPAEEETVPAEEEAAPVEGDVEAEVTEDATVPAEGEATEELTCLPEELVDGKCPPVAEE